MASQTAAPGQYPAQIVFVATAEQADALSAEALRRRVSKATVARGWFDAGRQASTIATEYGLDLDDVLNAARVYADSFAQPEKATTRTVEQ